MSDLKLYVLVRGDLSPGQKLAQSVHAGVEMERDYWTPETVVVLETRNEASLLRWRDHLEHSGYAVKAFYEPDFDEFTSLACISSREPFVGLPLSPVPKWRRIVVWLRNSVGTW